MLWSWVKDQIELLKRRISAAITTAKLYAKYYINRAKIAIKSWVNSTFKPSLDKLLSWWNKLKQDVSRLWTTVTSAVKNFVESRLKAWTGILKNIFIIQQALPAYIRDYVEPNIYKWLGLDIVTIRKIKAFFANPLGTIWRLIYPKLLVWIKPVFEIIWAVKAFFKDPWSFIWKLLPQVLRNIFEWLQQAWSTLLTFVENPLEFIASFIIELFLGILEWTLAYAIGTTKATLPPWPDIEELRGRGVTISGTGPPPGASGLAPPLSSIYVSGYTYRPGHRAVDLGLVKGQKVYAMHSGIVAFAGWSNVGYGNVVKLKGGEWWTLYAHLSKLNVRSGDRVGARHVVGLGGSTGDSTGPHLHLEIKYRGSYIDPITVL